MNKIIYHIFKVIAFLLASLVPKKKNLWLFGAWFGKSFSDNSKYLYLYIKDNHKNINAIWITKNKELLSDNNDSNMYYYKSFKGIYYQLTSGVIFYTHSVASDFNSPFIGLTTKRVSLWHGFPLKKIGFDDLIYTSKSAFSRKHKFLFDFLNNNITDRVISIGEECSEYFSSAFNVDSKKIILTGFPRNDVFNKDKIESNLFRAIYMPTFRGSIGGNVDLFEKYGMSFENFDAFLKENKMELTIRVHPANKPSEEQVKFISKSNNIILSDGGDIYSQINEYDCLITDYSSIMFDFVVSKKPIILAPFDIKNYLENDREMYFDYVSVSENNFCSNWHDVRKKLLTAKNEPTLNDVLYSKHDQHVLNSKLYSENVYVNIRKWMDF
ncbi:CDP-glycerol glycerophosphotransferase family protein [Vibrio alfacsensis]|uniref:CDP-glycerol glycerophosphotransferase family protein n=1 Tax=Vibrio alfacsensis TaxID=1074311 RepID=UPI00406850DF